MVFNFFFSSNNRYICSLVHHYEDPENLHILMTLVHGGELFDVIHTENDDGTWSSGLPESDAKFYACAWSLQTRWSTSIENNLSSPT
jgi:serine/threonine protein kinase